MSSNKAGNRIALVTGANRGIGLETARQLGRQGVTVLVGARDAARGELAASALRAEGIDARAVPLDVTDPESITAAARTVEQDFGRLDILVNNAAVLRDQGVPASEATADAWRETFEANVFGLVTTAQAFVPLLKKSDAGRIVNLSSSLGSLTIVSDPASPVAAWIGSGAAYGASKAAVNMFTAHLARELADTPVKVNTIDPGWVKTDMGTDAALLEVEEGARTSVWAATLPADGPTGGFYHLGRQQPW